MKKLNLFLSITFICIFLGNAVQSSDFHHVGFCQDDIDAINVMQDIHQVYETIDLDKCALPLKIKLTKATKDSLHNSYEKSSIPDFFWLTLQSQLDELKVAFYCNIQVNTADIFRIRINRGKEIIKTLNLVEIKFVPTSFWSTQCDSNN